jgi:hypothetical protein
MKVILQPVGQYAGFQGPQFVSLNQYVGVTIQPNQITAHAHTDFNKAYIALKLTWMVLNFLTTCNASCTT